MEAEEYEQFLTSMMALLTREVRDEDGTLRAVWRDDKDVIKEHFAKRRADGLRPPKDAPLTVCLSRWLGLGLRLRLGLGVGLGLGNHDRSKRSLSRVGLRGRQEGPRQGVFLSSWLPNS